MPASLANLPQLTSLQLHYNQLRLLPDLSVWLKGCLASAPSMSFGLAPACTLRFDSNLLNGSFPAWVLDTALASPFAVSNVGLVAPLLGFTGNLFTGPQPPALLAYIPPGVPHSPFTSAGAGLATTCPAGTFVSRYSAQRGVGTPSFPAPVCVDCPPGFTSSVGSTACSPRPLYTFAAEVEAEVGPHSAHHIKKAQLPA